MHQQQHLPERGNPRPAFSAEHAASRGDALPQDGIPRCDNSGSPRVALNGDSSASPGADDPDLLLDDYSGAGALFWAVGSCACLAFFLLAWLLDLPALIAAWWLS